MSFRTVIIRLTGGNKQAATFLLFVFLSAVIWTINALSKEHTTSFDIPIRYFQLPGAESDQSLPASLHITVKGKGFHLMRFSSALNGFSIVPKSISNRNRDTVISAEDALLPVMENYKGKLEITTYSPEQILMAGRQLYSKKLKVKPNVRLNYATSYISAGPSVIQPDSITLFSSIPIPDTITALYTEPFSLTNVESTVFRQVTIHLPGPEYHHAAANFWYLQPVEKATEVTIEVPIRNKQRAVNEHYLPSTVRLSCKVPLSKFRLTRADLFIVSPGDTSIEGDKVLVELLHAPYWASSVSITPTVVNRIIKDGY